MNQIAAGTQHASWEIVFALDAIQEPISLFEPIYNDGATPFCNGSISDERNTDANWVRALALKRAWPNWENESA